MAEDVRRQLQRLAKRREKMLRERHEITREMRDAIQAALDAGIPATEVARLAGVSRGGLYKILRDSG